MIPPTYPLQSVLEVKERRVEEAERSVEQKKKILTTEEEKLNKAEEKRNLVKEHKEYKLQQLRDEMDHATTSPKIQQMKEYLKICNEKLDIEEKKVTDQKKQVETAEKNLLDAREDLRLKRIEVDKMHTHKESWTKEVKEELLYNEERDLDEIGGLMHAMRKRRGF